MSPSQSFLFDDIKKNIAKVTAIIKKVIRQWLIFFQFFKHPAFFKPSEGNGQFFSSFSIKLSNF